MYLIEGADVANIRCTVYSSRLLLVTAWSIIKEKSKGKLEGARAYALFLIVVQYSGYRLIEISFYNKHKEMLNIAFC